MLVLSRKIGQTIIVNGHIKIHFLEHVNLGKIRVGIEAPDDVIVERAEKIQSKTPDPQEND